MPSEALQQLMERMERRRLVALEGPPRPKPTWEERRRASEESAFRVAEGTIVQPVEQDGVRGEWVRWPESDPAMRLMYLHGGAYVVGSPKAQRETASWLARASGCAVFSLIYGLGPERSFPAGLEDTARASAYSWANGPDGPAPARSVAFSGVSAGGGLVASAMIALRDRKLRLPDAAILMSPWADLAMAGESYVVNENPNAGPDGAAGRQESAAAYLNGLDPRDPVASAVYGDQHGLPPMFIQAGDAEVYRDDSIALAERARARGVDVTLEVWPELFHAFQAFAPLLPEG
jgi:acetyl esterase/lipase